MTKQARHIPFEAIHNFRDIGGYAGEGGAIRPGLVYRSATVHGATPADRERLRELGLRHIIDLRSDPEVAGDGVASFDDIGAAWAHIPIYRDIDASPEAMAARARLYGQDFADAYLHMLRRGGSGFRAALEAMASAEGPLVVHCAGGKDRAGNAIMLLLTILGVDRPTIIEDYALTAQHLPPANMERLRAYAEQQNVPVEDLLARHGAKADSMERTLARVDAELGGPMAYLADIGVSAETMDRLRARLLG